MGRGLCPSKEGSEGHCGEGTGGSSQGRSSPEEWGDHGRLQLVGSRMGGKTKGLADSQVARRFCPRVRGQPAFGDHVLQVCRPGFLSSQDFHQGNSLPHLQQNQDRDEEGLPVICCHVSHEGWGL